MSSTTAAPAVQRRGGAGARRGGRFGGGKSTAGNAANAAAAQPDDTEAVRNLRAKYADKLALLREMFSDWTDEDLLFALQDAGGEVELAVGRISEGHAEQFNSVKSKKQVKKENLSTATPASFHGTTGSANGTATNIPSSRGGRGGANAARGGRGGGAIRGGRGGSRGGATRVGPSGIPSTEEARIGETSAEPSSSTNTTKAAPTFADTVAATKQNGASSGAWGDDTEGLDLQADKPTTAAAKDQQTSTEAAAASATAADQTSEETKSSNPISNAIQKVTAKLVPKGSKLSWAQVARPSEPVKEQAQPPKDAPTAPAAQRAKDAKTLPTESANAAPKAPEKSEISHPIAAAPIIAAQDEPILESAPSTEALNAPAPTAVEADPVSSSVPSAADAAPASSRPAAGRAPQSQRALQRAKQDAPVVMPGGNAQFDSLGKRFGGLSFLGGDEADAEAQTQTQAVAPGTEQAAVSAAVPSTTATSSAAAPTHQDAFAQATSPQQFNEKETLNAHQYGYQQGLQQHQQAHQAAVAQAQNQNQSVANLSQQQNVQVPQQQDSQLNQYQQNSTGYGIQGQQQSQQQAQTQTPQAGQQGAQQAYGDYSSMYGGLDAQRLAGYYGNYDSNAASRGNDERSNLSNNQQLGQQQHQQPAAASQTDSTSAGGAPQVAPPQQQQQQQAQQQFPNMMPYYYPHYYLPNQFQHFGQPAAGYGQYALYGGQPQHPTKPTTPASLQSPYAQNLPHNDVSSSNPYGNTGNVGQYNQSPANTTALASSTYGDYGRGAPNNVATTDYTKLYGSNNASSTNVNNNAGSSIPGLSGFLGQQPSNGAGSQNKAQANTNTSSSNNLDNAYRQYDSNKLAGPSPGRQSVGLGGNQTGQVQSGLQNQQSQAQPHQQQSQSQQPQQQQQHYYQQYNAYAGHQQPNNASANYASYPYRQYWGQ